MGDAGAPGAQGEDQSFDELKAGAVLLVNYGHQPKSAFGTVNKWGEDTCEFVISCEESDSFDSLITNIKDLAGRQQVQKIFYLQKNPKDDSPMIRTLLELKSIEDFSSAIEMWSEPWGERADDDDDGDDEEEEEEDEEDDDEEEEDEVGRKNKEEEEVHAQTSRERRLIARNNGGAAGVLSHEDEDPKVFIPVWVVAVKANAGQKRTRKRQRNAVDDDDDQRDKFVEVLVALPLWRSGTSGNHRAHSGLPKSSLAFLNKKDDDRFFSAETLTDGGSRERLAQYANKCYRRDDHWGTRTNPRLGIWVQEGKKKDTFEHAEQSSQLKDYLRKAKGTNQNRIVVAFAHAPMTQRTLDIVDARVRVDGDNGEDDDSDEGEGGTLLEPSANRFEDHGDGGECRIVAASRVPVPRDLEPIPVSENAYTKACGDTVTHGEAMQWAELLAEIGQYRLRKGHIHYIAKQVSGRALQRYLGDTRADMMDTDAKFIKWVNDHPHAFPKNWAVHAGKPILGNFGTPGIIYYHHPPKLKSQDDGKTPSPDDNEPRRVDDPTAGANNTSSNSADDPPKWLQTTVQAIVAGRGLGSHSGAAASSAGDKPPKLPKLSADYFSNGAAMRMLRNHQRKKDVDQDERYGDDGWPRKLPWSASIAMNALEAATGDIVKKVQGDTYAAHGFVYSEHAYSGEQGYIRDSAMIWKPVPAHELNAQDDIDLFGE